MNLTRLVAAVSASENKPGTGLGERLAPSFPSKSPRTQAAALEAAGLQTNPNPARCFWQEGRCYRLLPGAREGMCHHQSPRTLSPVFRSPESTARVQHGQTLPRGRYTCRAGPARPHGNPAGKRLPSSGDSERTPEPVGAGAPTLPRGPAPPERSPGVDAGGPGQEGQSIPTHLGEPGTVGAALSPGRARPPVQAPCKPRARGWAMNGLAAGTSVPGRGVERDRAHLRGCSGASRRPPPGRASRAAGPAAAAAGAAAAGAAGATPSSAPAGPGRAGAPPTSPQRAHFSREHGAGRSAPGPPTSRAGASGPSARGRAAAGAPGATYRPPEGEATGRAAPRPLAAAPARGWFAQRRPI